MNERYYVGIDIGKKGFIVIQKQEEKIFYSLLEHNMKEIYQYLKEIKEKSKGNLIAVFEDVHALFGSSAKGTFEFGMQKGYMIGYLIALEIPYVAVSPKEWQKEVWIASDMVFKTSARISLKTKKPVKIVDTKTTSIKAAFRLFPCTDFKRTAKCKMVDDNKVDALLMSEYARRKNL
jgi:hypothetical protein